MDLKQIREALNQMTKDLDSITDPKAVLIIRALMNLVEVLVADNMRLREEVQQLRDEINRLKGEQGKPTIRPQTKDGNDNQNHSSEKQRKIPKDKKAKGKKKGKLSIEAEFFP